MALWTVAHQSPMSMGFSRQEHWSGLSFPSPGNLPFSRESFLLQRWYPGLLHCRQILYCLRHRSHRKHLKLCKLLTYSLASGSMSRTTLRGHQARLGTAASVKPRSSPVASDALCVRVSAVLSVPLSPIPAVNSACQRARLRQSHLLLTCCFCQRLQNLITKPDRRGQSRTSGMSVSLQPLLGVKGLGFHTQTGCSLFWLREDLRGSPPPFSRVLEASG